ncbi:MAG: NHLP bacteriocin system secretion protein [Lachnospiraceae bacterium]|nr:NHLP bacteriocin system secretion protein [Lachnospiraceae bacterium]
MKGVYNKEALNRIAAEDRLDRMIVLVSPATWLSIVGAFIIILVLLIWGFKGSLPTNVDTSGIYLNTGGSSFVYTKYDGFVVEVLVSSGDEIKEGDLIATLSTEDNFFDLEQLDHRIQYTENMTFDSELDVVTTDTQEMADIKLEAKKVDDTAEQTKANLELKKEKLTEAKKTVEDKEALVKEYKEKYYATLSVSDESAQLKYNEANDDYDTLYARYETAKNTYISSKETYYAEKDKFDAQYEKFDPEEHSDSEKAAYEASLANIEALRSQSADYQYFMEEQEKLIKEANDRLATARKEYLEYLNKVSGTQAENTIASTEYSEVLQDYYTAKNAYKSLKDEIDQLELQAVLDEGNADVSGVNYEQKFENKKSAVLTGLKQQRDSLLNEMKKDEIRAINPGRVSSVEITPGKMIAKGALVLTLLKNDEDGDTDCESAVCYVNLGDAKKLSEGMEAYVYPSTVDVHEYGHIVGKVKSVSDHVATTTEMHAQLGNDSLVENFSKEGPVVEVVCELQKDSNTVSGYHWSTDKGRDIDLSQGTMVNATIITEEKRPIDLLIPYIRHKLDFDSESENDGK